MGLFLFLLGFELEGVAWREQGNEIVHLFEGEVDFEVVLVIGGLDVGHVIVYKKLKYFWTFQMEY